MLKAIVAGKLYKNNVSAYEWDEIICVVEVKDQKNTGYVEYYFLARPNKGFMYIMPSLAKNNWDEMDESF